MRLSVAALFVAAWLALAFRPVIDGGFAPRPGAVERVSVRRLLTDSVSVDLQVSWSAVLDRRGGPVDAYNVEVKDVPTDAVITGSTVPGTQLADTLTVSRPAPGDSLLFYVRVRAVDDRGVQGQWGQSGTFKITNPDLLGPPAPGVSVDTIGLASGTVSVSPIWFTNGIGFDSAHTDMLVGETRQASVIFVLADGSTACYGDPAFCTWKGAPFISSIFPRVRQPVWFGAGGS